MNSNASSKHSSVSPLVPTITSTPIKASGISSFTRDIFSAKKFCSITATHKLQHFITTALQWYMKMRHKRTRLCTIGQYFLSQQIGFDGRYTITGYTFHPVKALSPNPKNSRRWSYRNLRYSLRSALFHDHPPMLLVLLDEPMRLCYRYGYAHERMESYNTYNSNRIRLAPSENNVSGRHMNRKGQMYVYLS